MATWLAIDVGGANLKAADGQGYWQSYPFPLWTDYKRLSHQLRSILSEAPEADHLLLTMTGELADCFESKSEGVKFILDAFGQAAGNRHTRVYLVDGRMVSLKVAQMQPLLAAASNWHALAAFSARFAPSGSALLIDMGSTTCDLIPLIDGKPVPQGKTDTTRLLSGELVYSGLIRTPVCALVQQVPYRGQMCPIAAELFATTADVHLLREVFPEDPLYLHTADGKPLTKANSRSRMARMIAADPDEFNHRDAVVMAEHVAAEQQAKIVSALHKVVGAMPIRPKTVILSGQAEILALAAVNAAELDVQAISLKSKIGAGLSRVAPAHALAVLAREAVGA